MLEAFPRKRVLYWLEIIWDLQSSKKQKNLNNHIKRRRISETYIVR